KNYTVLLLSGAVVAYAAFLQGGIDKTGYLWSVLLIAVSYLLMEIKKANIFSFLYGIFLFFTAVVHISGLVSLPYNPLSYFTILIIISIIIYVGNSVVKETLEKLLFLDKIANQDILTGLHNRKKLIEILKNELIRARRYNRPLSILLLDIDDFKKINDKFGHNFGDKILQEFAKLLKMSLRNTDHAGRWGGEEFIIVLPETNKKNAVKVAEKIRNLIGNYFEDIYGKKITVSIGLTEFKDWKNESIDVIMHEIIEIADKALYKAKRDGKNQVAVK
ncbi:GGDEF domain-containing protein, partial [Hydrogenivirga sp. 128-5-R1-1]|uniref:GGDEF domain-containing protein n=1 Tax=Hydrogenivirga sp. 128-5-R1-1 TaxID=392423 RepID=UPI00015F14A3